jgi:sugar lactone lactonase YvrE
MIIMNRKESIAVILILAIVVLGGCGKKEEKSALKTPSIAVTLEEKHNTPDGMAVDADGNILINIPNFSDHKYPAVVGRIDKDDNLTEIYTLPEHPITGRCAPLGIAVGPEGNLYIADNQSFFGRTDNQSRLVRVTMKDGKPTGDEILVTGIMQANAVVCTADSVFVTDTQMAKVDGKTISGVWRFKYDEFSDVPVVIAPYDPAKEEQDSHLVTTLVTEDENWWGDVGANGMGFGADGTMYVCNFGEASVVEVKLDAEGEVVSQKTLAQGNGIKSADGLKVCAKTGDIYIADFIGNAVHKIDPKTGEVSTVIQNENNSGGVDGKLDKPSEVCLRGNKIYVSNIDLTLDGNEYDSLHTISVAEID